MKNTNSRERGTAMVEAAICIPLLLVLIALGLPVYSYYRASARSKDEALQSV